MKKYITQIVILLGTIGLLWFLLVHNDISSSEAKYQKTIDSLNIEIGKKDIKITSLDSTRHILDSLVILDKAKLANIAKKAQQYKEQYEKEHNRINNMSDDDIISEFTTTFN
jgi:hypothetical protein